MQAKSILKPIYKSLFVVDLYISKVLGYSKYYKFHKLLGFPIVKINFKRGTGYWPNLKNPKTFNEKITANRIHNRDPQRILLTDKLAVKDYVLENYPEINIIKTEAVFETPDELKNYLLKVKPKNIIIKSNWTSGRNILIQEESYDIDEICSKVSAWCNDKTYGFQKHIWSATQIPRKIYIENLMFDQIGNLPNDYKFFCFDGKVKYCQIDFDRFSEHKRVFVDANYTLQEFSLKYPKGELPNKPQNYELMVQKAKEMAKGFPFVRIDFYSDEEQIYFGEYTFSPDNGCGKFRPESYDRVFGDLLQIIII